MGIRRAEVNESFPLDGDLALWGMRYMEITASTTLTVFDSGKVIGVNGTAAVTVTLPRHKRGVFFDIFNMVDQNLTVLVTASDDSIISGDATTADVAADQVAYTTSNRIAGSGGRFFSNGTKWFYFHMTANVGAPT